MCASGLRISTPEGRSMSPAVTSPGPLATSGTSISAASECIRATTSLRFRTMSVTSSFTPEMVENSCATPSIRTLVTAAPASELSSTRRSELPNVWPKPRSSGSIVNVPRLSSTFSAEIWGVWNSSMGFLRVGSQPPGDPRNAVGRAAGVLLRVELDDELLLHRRVDLRTLGVAQHLRRQSVVIRLKPRRDGGRQFGRVADHLGRTGPCLDRDHVVRTDLVRGHVHAPPVDGPVTVQDELAGLAPGAREAEPHQDVVEPALQESQQVLTRHAVLAARLVVVVAELLLEHTVVAAGLLLLAQLQAILRLLRAPAAVLARRVRAPLDAALVRQAALPLEEELHALAAALLALCTSVSRHQTRLRLRGRQPLWAWGVTSRMPVTSRPAAWSERIAVSRPEPGPFTNTPTRSRPWLMPLRAAASAVTWAANGVDLREPLKPAPPADSHAITLPSLSVSETIVLLKLVLMWAWPNGMFLPPRPRPPRPLPPRCWATTS